ncbi:acyltransferase [Streptococcus suis]|uniref:acyltransferase family protein n=2 Tax=Streptococcus suis TaxID=1307 RepID=UPI001C95E636|nr:acyltransferase [Streptococcus suis]MBY5026147.1 acyltransferase [Streptococcus suis]QZT16558.1 acyltransferase [Streptococcus suis]HEM5327119.1 acyltransferase [Streptococcus suis]
MSVKNFTSVNKSNPNRIALFDTIKCIMVLCVIFTHLDWSVEQRQWFIFPYFVDMAVPIFLLLSAYFRANKWDTKQETLRLKFSSSIKESINLLYLYAIVMAVNILLSYANHLIAVKPFSGFSSLRSFVMWLLSGESGPGSYYVPLLIQVVFLLPILYVLFEKNKWLGLLTCFLVNVLVDALFATRAEHYMYIFVYRLISLRYLFVLGLGIFLSKQDVRSKVDTFIATLFGIIGAILIFVNHSIEPFSWFYGWKSTSFLCVPFAYALLFFMIKYGRTIPATLLSKLGVASYHIYLTQMLYFSAVAPFLAVQFKVSSLNLWNVLFAFLICLFGGYIFYKMDLFMRLRGKR